MLVSCAWARAGNSDGTFTQTHVDFTPIAIFPLRRLLTHYTFLSPARRRDSTTHAFSPSREDNNGKQYFFEKMDGLKSPPRSSTAFLPHGQKPAAPTPPRKRTPDTNAIDLAMAQKEITDLLTAFYRTHNWRKMQEAEDVARYHLSITGSRDKCVEILNEKLLSVYHAKLC